MKLLSTYVNGNYTVSIYDDGTKVREADVTEFIPVFPECIDMKITNYCDLGCPYCHEDSTTTGKHAVLDSLTLAVLSSLAPYTELAIGGGNPLAHPELQDFLLFCKSHNIICNLTVNQVHFEQNITWLRELTDEKLIYGLGISVTDPSMEVIEKIKQFPNAVIHTIAGVTTISDYKAMAGHGLKVLVLGYKQFRRGFAYFADHTIPANIEALQQELMALAKGFRVISFDNLALKQLDVQSKLPAAVWNEFYMGDDGKFTMYIDLVARKFARNSTSMVRHDLLCNIRDIFAVVTKE
jgi:hypothetical protein